VNSLPKTVTRQRRDCELNPGPSAPESSTLTTLLSIVDNNTHYLHRPTRPDETILSRRVGSGRTGLCELSTRQSARHVPCARVATLPILCPKFAVHHAETQPHKSAALNDCQGMKTILDSPFHSRNKTGDELYCLDWKHCTEAHVCNANDWSLEASARPLLPLLAGTSACLYQYFCQKTRVQTHQIPFTHYKLLFGYNYKVHSRRISRQPSIITHQPGRYKLSITTLNRSIEYS